MENYIDDSRIHEGHRQRMRAKLLNHGQRIFDTYELLEMLLYHVIPYRDTNPVSKRLLYALGGLDGVLTADKEKLTAISGVGERTAEFIRSAGKLSSILGSEFVPSQNLYYGNFDVVGKYLTDYFKNENETCVIAMMLDNNMRLIETKKLYSLDYESAGVRPTAFVDAAISSRASVVISAHNHIHGPFCPTQGDRATHNAISVSLSAAGVFHAEHYVVCGDSYSAIGTLTGFSPSRCTPPSPSPTR